MPFIEISHTIRAGLRTYLGLPVPRVEVLIDHDSSRERYDQRAEFYIASLHLCGNTGTYMDSPFHRHRDGAGLAALSLERLAHLPTRVFDARGWGRGIGPERFAGEDLRGAPTTATVAEPDPCVGPDGRLPSQLSTLDKAICGVGGVDTLARPFRVEATGTRWLYGEGSDPGAPPAPLTALTSTTAVSGDDLRIDRRTTVLPNTPIEREISYTELVRGQLQRRVADRIPAKIKAYLLYQRHARAAQAGVLVVLRAARWIRRRRVVRTA